MTNICPSCQKGCLSPILKSSPFMIIKESPTQNELDSGTIFVTRGVNKYGHNENTVNYYLNRELGMVGLQLSTMNLMNFYMHIPPKVGRSKEQQAILQGCDEFSIQEVIRFTAGMKVILMMGAKTVKIFTGYNTSDVYGLTVGAELLPHVPVIVPAPNSDLIMRQPVGELRNALRVFSEQIQIYKQYSEV